MPDSHNGGGLAGLEQRARDFWKDYRDRLRNSTDPAFIPHDTWSRDAEGAAVIAEPILVKEIEGEDGKRKEVEVGLDYILDGRENRVIIADVGKLGNSETIPQLRELMQDEMIYADVYKAIASIHRRMREQTA